MEVVGDMRRYVALLRGINISGKNKIPMAELKKGFEKLAFEEVKTYLNSGNVIFSSNEDNTEKMIECLLNKQPISFNQIKPSLVFFHENGSALSIITTESKDF